MNRLLTVEPFNPTFKYCRLCYYSMVPFMNFVTLSPAIPLTQFKELIENTVSGTQSGNIPGGTEPFAKIFGFSFVWLAPVTTQVLDDDLNVITPVARV